MEILVLALIGFVVVVFFIAIVRGILQVISNLRQETLSLSAQVIAKRTEFIHGGGEEPNRTMHYVTFQTSDGERREYSMSSREYGTLAEGDRGTLSYRGTWYKGFQRQGVAVAR